MSKNIFVFGSNRAGRHGRGAARDAVINYGAIYGKGEGIQGDSYAIPTKDENLHTLPLVEIKKGVDRFLEFARKNPQLFFNLTAIGTGLAGYSHTDMAPMFKDAPSTCRLPAEWVGIIGGINEVE